MTIQEMFDKAVRGLAGQDWRRSATLAGTCLYHSPNGDMCAWGHVDPEGTRQVRGLVTTLAADGVGIAGQLTYDQQLFAQSLQSAHDYGDSSLMRDRFKALGEHYGLTWLEGC